MSGETLSTNTGENHEKALDPRVESLAIPLARDYAEKNYPKREDGTFEPAWRGVNGEKALKNKSPEDLMAEGYSGLAAHEAVIDIANQPYNEYNDEYLDELSALFPDATIFDGDLKVLRTPSNQGKEIDAV